MTPKEKAKDIVVNFYKEIKYFEIAKKCALIAVDLLLSEFYADEFYTEVKQEIEKL